MNYQTIASDNQLAHVCAAARAHAFVALDTEFVRTRTYYPQLGLIQLYDGETLSLIDPLTIHDWQPLKQLLGDKNVIKFLHAASEDLEVFQHQFATAPAPFIDTQILAAFLGHPLSWGFAAMVEHYSGVQLDKSESRTDWLARPLTARQCEYAAADVAYLLPIAHTLRQKAAESGWLDAALDECERVVRRRQEILNPDEAWRDITNASQLRTRQLACLQRLAAWRLRQARERDMAVNFVVREENLWKVARFMPGSQGELESLGLSGSEIRHTGKMLLDIVEQTRQLPEQALPAPMVNLIDAPGYRQAFKALKSEIQQIAERSGLSAELLASRRQINQLLNYHWQLRPLTGDIELLSGWREKLMGAQLMACLAKF